METRLKMLLEDIEMERHKDYGNTDCNVVNAIKLETIAHNTRHCVKTIEKSNNLDQKLLSFSYEKQSKEYSD